MTVPLATICAHIRATLPDCTPASVAAHFAINRFQLSRRFHRETGLPLRDYIAALKIEHGIAALVAQKPVIDSQLDAGHESAATYSHTFRAATGIAPARYRDKIAAYSATLSAELACPQPRTFSYHGYAPQQHPQPRALTVRLRGGETRHAVFTGLFPAPIPRGVPVLGRALFHCREFCIDAIPDGTYYLLACEIPHSRNPLRYFRLDHCLRALHPAPVIAILTKFCTRRAAEDSTDSTARRRNAVQGFVRIAIPSRSLPPRLSSSPCVRLRRATRR